MSTPKPIAPMDAPTFPGAQGSVERAASVAGPYLIELFRAAAPTPATLRALAEELRRAAANPASVAHPELADADTYWRLSAWPQAAAVVKDARAALVEVADELAPAVDHAERVLETWLRAHLSETAAARRADPGAARAATVDALIARCQELHRVVESIGRIQVPADVLVGTMNDVAAARRRQAEEDVKHARAAVERESPHLDRHQFKQWWNELAPQRVAARDTELRAELPFRHEELAVLALGQALTTVDADVEAMIDQLTAPILEIGKKLVVRYDMLVAEFDAANSLPYHE